MSALAQAPSNVEAEVRKRLNEWNAKKKGKP